MKILNFYTPKDSDLKTGLKVCYKDTHGAFTKLGIITDILNGDGIKNYLIDTAMGAYTADELKLIEQEPANIKPSNYKLIIDLMKGKQPKEIFGMKMQALYKLIQAKGEHLSSEDERYNGLKALKLKHGEYIAMKRTGSTKTFYPCIMQTYQIVIE